MTQEEYDAKYGANSATNTITMTQEEYDKQYGDDENIITMTQEEYDAKYGSSQETKEPEFKYLEDEALKVETERMSRLGETLDQAGQDVLDIGKINLSKAGGFVNATLANINEMLGIDSSLFRSNQEYYKAIADESKKKLSEGTYKDSPIIQMLAEEAGNPLAYYGAGLKTISQVAMLDTMFNKSIGKDAGEGATLSDAGDVATAGSVTAVVGKLAEKVLNNFEKGASLPDNSASKLLNSYTDEQKVHLANAYETARKAGVNILGSDVDPATTGAKMLDIMKKRPEGVKPIADLTNEDVGNFVKFYDDMLNKISAEKASPDTLATAVKTNLDNQAIAYEDATKRAFSDFEYLTEGAVKIKNQDYLSFIEALRKNVVSKKLTTDSEAIKAVTNWLSLEARTAKNAGTDISVNELRDKLSSVINKVSEANSAVGGGKKAKAFTDIGTQFEKLFDTALDTSKSSDTARQVLNEAKRLYKERLDSFGYRGTGKGATTNFIPKFLNKIQTDSENAIKMIKTSEQWDEVKTMLPEETRNAIIRQRLQNFMVETDGVLDLHKFANEVQNKSSQKLLRNMLGDTNYKTLTGLSEVAKLVGKRQKDVRTTNVLSETGKFHGTLGQIMQTVKQFYGNRLLAQALTKYGTKSGEKIERKLSQVLKRDNISVDEFLKNIDDLEDYLGDQLAFTSKELYQGINRTSTQKALPKGEGRPNQTTGQSMTVTPKGEAYPTGSRGIEKQEMSQANRQVLEGEIVEPPAQLPDKGGQLRDAIAKAEEPIIMGAGTRKVQDMTPDEAAKKLFESQPKLIGQVNKSLKMKNKPVKARFNANGNFDNLSDKEQTWVRELFSDSDSFKKITMSQKEKFWRLQEKSKKPKSTSNTTKFKSKDNYAEGEYIPDSREGMIDSNYKKMNKSEVDEMDRLYEEDQKMTMRSDEWDGINAAYESVKTKDMRIVDMRKLAKDFNIKLKSKLTKAELKKILTEELETMRDAHQSF